LIDRSRVLLDRKTVKTILGYKHRTELSQAEKQVRRMGGRGRETYV